MSNIPPVQRPPGAPVERTDVRPAASPNAPTQLLHAKLQGVDGFSTGADRTEGKGVGEAITDPAAVAAGSNHAAPHSTPFAASKGHFNPHRTAPKHAALRRRARLRLVGFAVLLLVLGALAFAVLMSGRPSSSARTAPSSR